MSADQTGNTVKLIKLSSPNTSLNGRPTKRQRWTPEEDIKVSTTL